ncbi:remorin 4.1-like [Phragmites australis]|uniref:remorin 4.1-like n=1 Tax=Phragmites australis TaxID=29695 RepID=UPI002D79B29B|nr:remorin 4.1-like [Phragmites australis]
MDYVPPSHLHLSPQHSLLPPPLPHRPLPLHPSRDPRWVLALLRLSFRLPAALRSFEGPRACERGAGRQVDKARAWLKKYERKLEEKQAKAMEKVQNEVAKVRHNTEEKRASVEAKWGTKVACVLELANFMRAVGRVSSTKRSFF